MTTLILDQICSALGPDLALVINSEGQVLTLGRRHDWTSTPAAPVSEVRSPQCTTCGEPVRYHAS